MINLWSAYVGACALIELICGVHGMNTRPKRYPDFILLCCFLSSPPRFIKVSHKMTGSPSFSLPTDKQ